LKTSEPISTQTGTTCFTGQGHETINFENQEFKGQVDEKPKLDLLVRGNIPP